MFPSEWIQNKESASGFVLYYSFAPFEILA